MKKLIAAIVLAAVTFGASADTMWPNDGRGKADVTHATKSKMHPLAQHLTDMGVSFGLKKRDGVPVYLIVLGGPDEYKNVDFLCKMAKEYGGVNAVTVRSPDGLVDKVCKL